MFSPVVLGFLRGAGLVKSAATGQHAVGGRMAAVHRLCVDGTNLVVRWGRRRRSKKLFSSAAKEGGSERLVPLMVVSEDDLAFDSNSSWQVLDVCCTGILWT